MIVKSLSMPAVLDHLRRLTANAWLFWPLWVGAIAVSLWLAFNLAEVREGVDASAYQGAAILMHEGSATIYTPGFKLMAGGTETVFLPFLYHPVVAAWFTWLLEFSGLRLYVISLVTNWLGVATLTAGVVALATTAGRGAWRFLPLMLLACWLARTNTIGLSLGNLGVALAGLTLLAMASAQARRWVLAGALFAICTVLKPFVGLAWIFALLLWRPDESQRQDKFAFLATWALVYAVLSAVTLVDTERNELVDYFLHLKRMGGVAWTTHYLDGSLSGALHRLLAPAQAVYLDMTFFGVRNWEANIGLFGHPHHGIIRVLLLAATASFVALVVWRCRSLANQPERLLCLALAGGLLLQPMSWMYNYGTLLALPPALWLSGAPHRWVAASFGLVVALGFPPAYWLRHLSLFPTLGNSATAPVPALAWWSMQLIAGLPTLLLGALVGVLLVAPSRATPDRPSANQEGA